MSSAATLEDLLERSTYAMELAHQYGDEGNKRFAAVQYEHAAKLAEEIAAEAPDEEVAPQAPDDRPGWWEKWSLIAELRADWAARARGESGDARLSD